MAATDLYLFLTVLWIGQQCVIVAVPGHRCTHLLFDDIIKDPEGLFLIVIFIHLTKFLIGHFLTHYF